MSDIVHTFSNIDLKMRYQEPYVTGGLNSKFIGVMPKGIYRGFKLVTNGAARTVTVQADSVESDHVAIVETSSGFALTIRKTGGDFNLDLSSAGFNSKTLVIALEGIYTTSAATTATINAYEFEPTDNFTGEPERPYLIVLGTVVVPAGATVIPTEDIRPYFRNYAWENTSKDLKKWKQLIANSSFENSLVNTASQHVIDHWDLYQVTGATTHTTLTNPNTGLKSFELNATTLAGKTGIILKQDFNLPVIPGIEFKLQFYVKNIIAASIGSLHLRLHFGDETGADIYTEELVYVLSDGTGPYELIEKTFRLTDPDSFILKNIDLYVDNVVYPSTGITFAVDDVKVFMEDFDDLSSKSSQNTRVFADKIVIEETGSVFADPKALLSYDGSNLILENRHLTGDNDPILNIKKGIILGENNLTTDAKAILPRISAKHSNTATVDYTLLFESEPNTGDAQAIRFYAGNNTIDAGFLITFNASWTGTTWTKDQAGVTATAIQLNDSNFKFFERVLDADWTVWTSLVKLESHEGLQSEISNGLKFTSDMPALRPLLDRIAVPLGTSARTSLFEFNADTSNLAVRFYLTSDGVLELVYNAEWTTLWNMDDGAFNASKITFDGQQFKFFVKDLGATTWNDASWETDKSLTLNYEDNRITQTDGKYKFTNVTTLGTGSNPPSTTGLINEIRASTICKAWAIILNNSGTVTVEDGANIDTASVVVPGDLLVTLQDGMIDENYSVTATVGGLGFGPLPYFASVGTQTSTTFKIRVYDATGAQVVLSSTADVPIHVQVFGKQSS